MTRSGQWEVVRRCLRLIARLERGPTRREELVALAYPDIPAAAAVKRFENDLRRLRDSLDVEIVYDHATATYALCNAGLVPLIDLPDDALVGLAFLEQSFDLDTPQFRSVQTLLSVITALLNTERRSDLAQARATLALDLSQRDNDPLDETVWQKLEIAHLERRLVRFAYRSPQQDDQAARHHLVEARKLYFDTVRHHYYLWGYCRWVEGPHGRWEARRFFRYRVGRIVPGSIELDPTRFPAMLPRVPTYAVIYRLAPKIARLGVSQHFDTMQVTLADDGAATIHAETDDVFYAARTLLHYGPNCKVLGGPEVLTEVRRLIREMAALYAK